MEYFTEIESRIPSGEVRTRFAPSPTGYMHVGNLRTALYEYLLAKKHRGKFILRIEDTDQARFVEGSVDAIYSALESCGIVHDEGPDVGGPVGPYIQTERREIYQKYAELLIEKGGAYRCFCTGERLERLRSADPHGGGRYDGLCASLTLEEIDEKFKAGVPFVIRQKIPRQGETTFTDAVFGQITVENSSLDDNVLIKSDGLPTYNFANVVDDHLMGITHVVRGSEYLSSAPKYNLLYEAFGWEIPEYIHCSPVMRDAQNKLSKRRGDPTYEDLISHGFVSQAIVNYVALLGWSPGGEREFFTLNELAESFSVEGISKSPAIFDLDKLKWFNSEYLRAMDRDEFYELALPYLRQAVKRSDFDLADIAELVQSRCEVLTDIPERVDFFDALPDYDTGMYVHKKMKTDEAVSLQMLKSVLPVLEGLEDWSQDSIHDALMSHVQALGVKNGQLLWPIRVAVSGKQSTPGGAVELCFLLGKRESLLRIQDGIRRLSNFPM